MELPDLWDPEDLRASGGTLDLRATLAIWDFREFRGIPDLWDQKGIKVPSVPREIPGL